MAFRPGEFFSESCQLLFFVEHFLTEFAGNSLLWAVTHMGSVMFFQTAERSENAYLVRKQGGHFPMKASE